MGAALPVDEVQDTQIGQLGTSESSRSRKATLTSPHLSPPKQVRKPSLPFLNLRKGTSLPLKTQAPEI
jgi:hypothetical protein